jgi:two-component system nitrogen regulation sensor histidine kinase NtrY
VSDLQLRPSETDGAPAAPRRRPLRDNPRFLIAAMLLLVAMLVGLFYAAGHTSQLMPGVFSETVSFALAGVNLTILAVLVFVLLRNLIKLWHRGRGAEPFSRFRAKLVGALLAMALVPAGLVLIMGSEMIRSSAERWFSSPVDAVLQSAQGIASQYYAERKDAVVARADRLARTLGSRTLRDEDAHALKLQLTSDIGGGLLELYRMAAAPPGPPDAALLVAVQSPAMPRDIGRASADRVASRVIVSGRREQIDEPFGDGLLLRAAAPVRNASDVIVGAIVVSDYLDGDMNRRLQFAKSQFEEYQQLKVSKGLLKTVYLSGFLAVTLLILVSATWLGLYVAKRIARPVQRLAEGARAIGAGQLDLRIEPETGDELGSLVEAFNMMAAELGTSQERLEQSRHALEQKNVEVDARRRYIETILERIATGVISLTADGRISTINGAAARLLGLTQDAIGEPVVDVLSREDLLPLLPIVQLTRGGDAGAAVQEITLSRDDREIHLAVAGTLLAGERGALEGAVVVLDDVTPLIRAQRVAAWRDVARRLAHEIKNPLTPIQLSAERLRRNFTSAPPNARALVDECTGAIVTEVEALKGLVDEFAQFARMRAPRAVPADVARLVGDALRLYDGVLHQSRIQLRTDMADDLPVARVDVEQVRQVIINLVDNAIEALGGTGGGPRPTGDAPVIVVGARHDAMNGVIRITITDNGPGVPAADRDKLFMPYYSTKGRGSGLGLAIVRRIVAEHGGSIEASNAEPHGTCFTVELPVG